MSNSNDPTPTGNASAQSVSNHANDHVNLRVTYLHAGNPRPPHDVGSIPTSTTIGELKSRLQTELLENPRPEEQRLIYQGRPLMQNNASLKEALRLEGPVGPLPYTIHIIIQPRRAPAEFRPTQAPHLAHPPQPTQPSAGVPPLNPPALPAQQLHPHPALEHAQRAQAIANAQLNMLQHQLATWNPMLAQNAGQMPQNFSATFQIHGQPIHVPHNNHPGSAPAPLHAQTPAAGAQATTGTPPPHSHGQASINLPPEMPTYQRPLSAPGHPRHQQAASVDARNNPRDASIPHIVSTGFPPIPAVPHLPHPFHRPAQTAANTGQPTVWLASSRNGPEALLFAPGHGYFSSHLPAPQPRIVPTRTTQSTSASLRTLSPSAPGQAPATNINQNQNQVAIRPEPGQARARAPRIQVQDNNDFWALVVRRGWLFLRLYMFMFVLSEPGTWRRYALLMAAVIVCLLPRENPLNNLFAAVRRHIDNLIGPPAPQPRDRGREAARGERPRQGGPAQQAPATQADGNAVQPQPPSSSATARPPVSGAVTTTPEQTARRLLQEHEQRHPNILRDVFYRVEQAVALFLASLVPGVGERHVAAREEARRLVERERVEAQRVREEEERKKEEAVKAKKEKETERFGEEGVVEGGESSKSGTGPAGTSNAPNQPDNGMNVETGSSTGVEGRQDGEEADVRARFT